jgi:Chitin binding Peritrophin-A domain
MGMVYDELQNACDCGGHKLCNDRVVFAPCPRMIGPNICKEVTLGTLLPHPHACDVFFQCGTVGPLVFKCPQGTVFNPTINVCDWPHNTNCEADQVAVDMKRQFVQCFGSICRPSPSWTVCNCPNFSGCPCTCAPAISQPLEVHITPKPIVATTTRAPETTPAPTMDINVFEEETHNRTSHVALQMCPSVDHEDPQQPVHLPHEQCHFFYKCYLGVPITFKCPSGLVWNIDLDRCDYRSDFVCQM